MQGTANKGTQVRVPAVARQKENVILSIKPSLQLDNSLCSFVF